MLQFTMSYPISLRSDDHQIPRFQVQGMPMKHAVWVAVISKFELFRRGISDILANAGYEHVHSFRNPLELDDYLATHCHPDLVLLDTDEDYTVAATQITNLGKLLGPTKRVALADDSSEIWARLCRNHDFSLLLRTDVSPKSLIRILRRVMAGERVLPNKHEPDRATENVQDRSKPSVDLVEPPSKQNRQSTGIPCLVCQEPFETEDRRTNRICPRCKSRSSWRYGTSEHAIQY